MRGGACFEEVTEMEGRVCTALYWAVRWPPAVGGPPTKAIWWGPVAPMAARSISSSDTRSPALILSSSWRGAALLAKWIEKTYAAGSLTNQRVVELGSGVGLVGTLLAESTFHHHCHVRRCQSSPLCVVRL